MYRSVKSRLGNRVGNDGNHVGNADGKMAVNGGETSEEVRNNNVLDTNNTQKIIIDYLASNPNMTAADLSIKTGLSRTLISKVTSKVTFESDICVTIE